jgi:hypothetical protein
MGTEGLTREVRSFSIEAYAKILGTLGVLIYVAGLFTVNFHLAQYGIAEYALLRVRYLLAGGWACLALVFSGLGPAIVLSRTDLTPPGSPWSWLWVRKKALQVLALWLPPLAGWLFIFHRIQMSGHHERPWIFSSLGETLFLILVSVPPCMLAVALLTWPAGSGGKSAAEATNSNSSVGLEHRPSALIPAILVFSFLAGSGAFGILFLQFFAVDVYPNIPGEYGGGRPERARLLVSGATRNNLKSLGLPLPPGSLVTFPLEVLHMTDQMVLVKTSIGNIIDVDRKTISGVQLRPEPWVESPSGTPWDFRELYESKDDLERQVASLDRRECFEAEIRDVLVEAGVPGWTRKDGKITATSVSPEAVCGYACEIGVEKIGELKACAASKVIPCMFKQENLPECK